MSTLMGHLITRLADQPENWAIESVSYLLSASPISRDALVSLFARTGTKIPRDLRFRAQATGDDQARPDMEGVADGVGSLVILEAKFWAPLTDHQPITYLNRLPADQPGILAFIAPSNRFSSLWPELVLRCRAAQTPLAPCEQIAADYWHASLPSGHRLALVSWRLVLTEIKRALEQAQDQEHVADVVQLLGLCERMDDPAFLPLQANELAAPKIAQRHRQFEVLAKDKIPRAALADGICTDENRLAPGSTGKLQPSSGDGYAGHYLRLNRIQVLLCYDWRCWAKYGQTPLWLRFDDTDRIEREAFKAASTCLAPLRSADPPRLIEEPGQLLIPLALPVGQEEHEVIRHLLGQLREIGTLLKPTEMRQVAS